MAQNNCRTIGFSVTLIFIIALFSKCDGINDFKSDQLDELKAVLKDGLLKQIAKSIIPEDSGNAENCAQDLLKWSEDLLSETWAMKMLDAGGRPPHGLLEGNINSVGMFEECLGISHQRNDSRTIKGKYCLARIPLPGGILGISADDLSSLREVFRRAPYVNQRLLNTSPRGLNFNIAVCMPDSCRASDVEAALAKALASANISLDIEIPASNCSIDEPSPWDAGEVIAGVVLALVGVLLLFGTIYDVWFKLVKKGDIKSQNFLLTAFSMYANSKRLTTLSKDPGPLACLHGIRVISIVWIILGHRFLNSLAFPVENLNDMLAWMQSYPSQVLIASTVSVDTFLLLSGLLLSYIFFRRTDDKSLGNIPMMYLHRVLRLTPVLVMVLLLQLTLFAKVGRGPFWKAINFPTDNCKPFWWSTLLYVQIYVNPVNMCLGHTWYLNVDMQLYIISPLLLFPILKHAKFGLIWVWAWIVAALVTIFTVCYLNEWTAATASNDQSLRQNGYYFPAYMRASPWLIGIVAGYYLRIWNFKEIKMNKMVVIFLWIASLAVMAAVLFGMKPLQNFSHEFSHWKDTTYLAFSRPAWALAVLWVICACAFGYGGPVNWLLSLRLWEFLARLSYSMYLIHYSIIIYFVSIGKTVPYFDNTSLVHLFFGDLLLTTVVSYFMVLAFESPVTILEKAIFKTERKKQISQNNLVFDSEVMNRTQDQKYMVD